MLEIDIDWSRVATMRGRIGRRAFWKLAGLPLLVVVGFTWWGLLSAPDGGEAYDTAFFGALAISLIGAFFGVRRLHDMGRSGWWVMVLIAPFLLAWIPVVNIVILAIPLIMAVMFGVFTAARGTWGPNAYGRPGSGSPFPEDQRFPN